MEARSGSVLVEVANFFVRELTPQIIHVIVKRMGVLILSLFLDQVAYSDQFTYPVGHKLWLVCRKSCEFPPTYSVLTECSRFDNILIERSLAVFPSDGF
jgi:hypothetical protein